MPARTCVKVLSIDGGGIRGIIPALVLAEIERLTKQPACELFDLIAGTSAGGIITLGVTAPAKTGGPAHSAAELAQLFVDRGPEIFSKSLAGEILNPDGVLHEKFSAKGLESTLEEYVGGVALSQALTDVLVTSYDIQSHEPFFFKRSQAQREPARDYPMTVVGRATSAAPTYFEPERAVPPVRDAAGPADYALVDGGTFANNPALCAYAEAVLDHPDSDILVVSLGTGRLTETISYETAKHWGLVGWARPLLAVMMDGSSATIDYQLDQLLGGDRRHFRFQTVLNGVSDKLDDVDDSNIEGLQRLAGELIEGEAGRLEQVCKLLSCDPPA